MRKINAIVMTLAGLLLTVASILKAHELLVVYYPSWRDKGVWESWEFFLVLIPLQFALGVWMVSGLFRKAAWLAGTVMYFLFIGVTLHKALTGAVSCGCFGVIQVNPWITLLAIDVPFTALLMIFRPTGVNLLPPPWPNVWHAIVTAAPVFAALFFTAPLLVAFRPEFIKPVVWDNTQIPVAQLDPRQRPVDPAGPISPPAAVETEPTPSLPEALPLWPWLEYADIAEQMKEGIVIVYMYHYTCSICADSIPQYEAYIKKMAEMGGVEGFRIAYLAIPPHSRDGSGPVPADTTALHGKLTDTRRWAVTSPFVVALIDGAVIKQWPQGTAPEPAKILDEIFAQ
ncbi:MAG TPA: MauE/DoxX family redox-associated membrane protein [Sedimentisphaerales bacterium]|nr:MauE/DoxX family redox-associated membrane protein [Sedimentisphaerales bacterium]